MEGVGFEVEGGHLGIGNFDALLVAGLVETAGNGEAGCGGGVGNQLDDHLVADQRLAAPVLGDEGEQAVLDTIPLAGAGRQVVDGDGDAKLVGEGLELAFPQPQAHTVAAAAVGGDQQTGCIGVASRAEFVPPAADALDREDGSVVGYAEIDPSGVGGDVVDAIGHRLAEFGDGEVVHPDRLRMAFRAKLAAAVLAVANQLLLLRVDRDHRLAGGLERLHRRIAVLELRVAVGMLGALTGLAVALQAEPELGQQPANQLLPGGEALPSQRRGEMRWLLLTQRSEASGSPRIEDCTRPSSEASSRGCVSVAGLLPPPLRRTRPAVGVVPSRSSARPRPIVLRAIPLARETAAMPPRPAACASLAANSRRVRSFSKGARVS